MSRSPFTEKEARLVAERRLKYLGTAKVGLDEIHFNPPLPRDLDRKNVRRLCEIFRKNRCRRLDVRNHVPAIVSQSTLTTALQRANIQQDLLFTNDPRLLPRLEFPGREVQALHGRHRLQAGIETLPPIDRWWTVDLYSNEIGNELKSTLIEEYADEKKPTDGEIYRKIRQYEGESNEGFRERWFLRLSEGNQDRLKQLDKNRDLRLAFDRLLPIPGLWSNGMRLSILHRVFAAGCILEATAYLESIWSFWSTYLGLENQSMKKIDQDTVESLQLLSPGRSRSDSKVACGLVMSGQVFAEFSEDERRALWELIKDFDRLIPSLYTFFEDFKYLESCAHCIKRLLDPTVKSIWDGMKAVYVPLSAPVKNDHAIVQCIIQTSESTFRTQKVTEIQRLETGYLQLWLYAMRHYPSMPPDPKDENELLAKPARAKPDKRVLYEMAMLARQLGFQSAEINALIKSCPDHQIARSALLQARKPDRYQYDEQLFEKLVGHIVTLFDEAIPGQPKLEPELLANHTVKRRCRSGMPQTRTHKQDSPSLFLDHLRTDIDSLGTLTSLFVRRCVFLAFFGSIDCAKYNENTHFPGTQGGPPLFGSEDHVLGAPETSSSPDIATPSGQSRGDLQDSNHNTRFGDVMDIDHENIPEDRYSTLSDKDHSCQQDSHGNSSPLISHNEMASSKASHQSVPRDPDSISHCTRISFDESAMEQAVSDGVGMGNPDQTVSRTGSMRFMLPEVGEIQQSSMNDIIVHLRRVEEEQEILEDELDHERLQEELGLSAQEVIYESQDADTSYGQTGDDSHVATAIEEHVEPDVGNLRPTEMSDKGSLKGLSSHRPAGATETQPSSAQDSIMITFWLFQGEDSPGEEWKQTDSVRVSPADQSSVERLAKKYIWKGFSLYDRNLQTLSPAQCYRAAIFDGSNAIFLISGYEEKKLEANGRLNKGKNLLSQVSRLLDRVGIRG